MLKIGINTGTAWLKVFEVEGTKMDDVAMIIDDYVQEAEEDEFARWSYEEALEASDGDELLMDETFFPINGGEYYIGRVELIEEF